MKENITKIVQGMDFSGSKRSWFDLWHLHLEESENIHLNSKNLEGYLKVLIDHFNFFRVKLEKFPKPFQLWIEIDEEEFTQNAVYIHSTNPNHDNFPIQYGSNNNIRLKNQNIESFMLGQGLSFKAIQTVNGNIFCFYDVNFGVPLG